MIRQISPAYGILALLMAGPSHGFDLDDLAARNAAIASIKSRQRGIAPDCPKTRRKEQLEEGIFHVHRELVVDGKLNEAHFVYEVVDIGCYTIEDSSLVIHAIDHPGTFGYVAVDKVSGKTYRLWADVDARNEFNRLMNDVDVNVTDGSGAIRVAQLYREMVLGPFEGTSVSDGFQLRQLAERSFRAAYGEAGWSRRFDQWWHRFEAAGSMTFENKTQKVPEGWIVVGQAFEGFKLTIPRTQILGSPSVVSWRLRISPAGQVADLTTRVVFQ